MNATISDIDGTPKASWTFRQHDDEFSNTVQLTNNQFSDLWNGLNAPVFTRHAVRDLNAQLDFRTKYVVGVVFNMDGETGRGTFLIPQDETDPDWLEWLRQIRATQRDS